MKCSQFDEDIFGNSRVGNGFSGVETPLFENMLVVRDVVEEAEAQLPAQGDDVQELAAEEVVTDVVPPTPTPPSPPSPVILSLPPHQPPCPPQPQDAEGSSLLFQQVLATCSALAHRVEVLENDKAAQQLEIVKLKAKVKKLEKINMVKSSKLRRLKKDEGIELVADQEKDAEVEGRHADKQADIYNIDLDHSSKVLSIQKDDTEVVAASTPIPAAKSKILNIAAAHAISTRRRKGVVIRDPEEELTSDTPAETSKVKDKGKGILIEASKPIKKKDQIEMDAEYARKLPEEINKEHEEAYKNIDWNAALDHNTKGYKMDFFKGKKYDEILPIFQANFDANIRFLFKSREEMEKEDEEIIKSINKTPAQKAAKRRKLSEEAQEANDLRKRLEIVQDEDDDVFVEAGPLAQKVLVVDYQIVVIDNKPKYKIIRADDTHQFYISFTTLLKNFDREDLETLWRIVTNRFSTSKPTNFSDEYLLLTLKTMFEEPDGQDAIWRNQKSVHGLALLLELMLLKRFKKNTKCVSAANEELTAAKHRTSWNEFSSAMASAVICLSSGQRFNFLNYIFESLVRNVDSSSKFYMYPRFIQLIIQTNIADLSKHTTRYISPALTQKVFVNMRRVGKEPAIEEVVTDVVPPTPTPPSLPSPVIPSLPPHQPPCPPQTQDAEGSSLLFQQVLATCFALAHRVDVLENDKAAQQLEIVKLKARVKKLEKINMVKSSKLRRLKKVGTSQRVESSDDVENVFNQGRIIVDMDQDEGIELVLSMQEDDTEVQEAVEIVTTTKLITEVVTAAATQVVAASIPILATKSKILNIVAAPVVSTRRRKGVVIRDSEEELTSDTPAETPKVKDKGKGILIEAPKPIKKKDQIDMDAEYARKLQEEINKEHEEAYKNIDWNAALDHVQSKEPQYIKRYHGMKKKPQTKSEARKNMIFYLKNTKGYKIDFFKGKNQEKKWKKEDEEIIKSINETPAQKAAKRRKLSKEAQEADDLRKRLEIVQDEDDDVFIEAAPLA
nr:hypothetical protein [Tanacetum cinerariifolium]